VPLPAPHLRSAAFAHEDGERLLLLPLAGGCAELDAAVALNGTARTLWQALEAGAEPGDLAAGLVARHGLAPAVAAAEVARLLDVLRAHRLLADEPARGEGREGEAAEPAGALPPVPPTLDASGLVALARAVLRAGHRLRFRARGLSMRPQVSDGAILEVEPRPFSALRGGDVALYVVFGDRAGEPRLVAHRVVGRAPAGWRARGDSAGRVDLVTETCHLGVVTARLEPSAAGLVRVPLDVPWRRRLAPLTAVVFRTGRALTRAAVARPLRALPPLRRAAGWLARTTSSVLRRSERLAARLRRRCDVAAAVLQTTAEKDAARRRLYATRAVRSFTALDENVTAGLTLIEEVMLFRHPLPAGPVLVLGCGPGRECVALVRAGHAVTGLDRDPGMLEHARTLAAREGVGLDLVAAEADAFDLGGRRFGAVIAFSGLYNMVLPGARRVALLRCAAAHLEPGGRVYVTFLSDYVPPGSLRPVRVPTLATAIEPEHEAGDLWLQNETVHVFAHPDDVVTEACAAGLTVAALFRDQRAYDRQTRQVRGYAVLAPRP